MDSNNLKKVVSSLSKLIEDSERISLPFFAVKLAKASEAYPEDQTIGVMADVIARMADSKTFITRSELKDLYNRLYSRNTKFAALFADELGKVANQESVKTYNREHDDESLSLMNRAYEKVVDPTLANALNAAFGNKTLGYNKLAAEEAKKICENSCYSGKLASTVEVVGGNFDFIICRASFETPKGITSLYVPIEIVAGQALLPSVFIGNNGPEDFSKSNLKNYIVVNAGKRLSIKENIVLEAIMNAKNGNLEKVSSVDLAVTKLNALKETKSDIVGNNILFQKVAAEDPNLTVSTPRFVDSEFESFAKSFENPFGIASFKFGKEKVEACRKSIASFLSNFDMKNVQVSVCDSSDDSVVYAVSGNSGRTSFRVPVKISNPALTILIVNGSIRDFSQKTIFELLQKESIDYKTAAVSSPVYGLKASELVETVRQAMAEQNYAKAEDALNVLSQAGDDKAYQTAFAAYSNGLKEGSSVKVGEENKCSRVVKNAYSKHALCGHTGLPLHKVYQDKNGDCHPLYRKGMEDTREGAYFLNSKIFF